MAQPSAAAYGNSGAPGGAPAANDLEAVEQLSRAYKVMRSELGKVIVGQEEVVEQVLTVAGFTTGLLLLSVFPSDLVILVTVGINLAQQNSSLLGAVPFIVATILIAALPVLSYLLFRRRAQRVMPKVRDWMNTHSWLVNIIVYIIFILLILF